MTDREKLLKFVETHNGTFEDLVAGFMISNHSDFPASRISRFIRLINDGVLIDRIDDGEQVIRISKEKATFLVRYLKGEMYTTKEAAEAHVPVQLKNAEAIIEACKKYER